MNLIHLFLFMLVLLVSGCIAGSSPALNDTGQAVASPRILVQNISIEHSVYKSAEVMRFSVLIDSNADIENAHVSASGISGKMNLRKIVNLTEGQNSVPFEFTLPRCNVCGGIRPGNHSLAVHVSCAGNVTADGSATVEIQQ